MNLAICSIIKDEREDYLKEWINYHLLIGVDMIYIYDNNSTPHIKYLLGDMRQVQVFRFESTSPHKHMIAYDDFINKFRYSVTWAAFIDSDEFIVVNDVCHNYLDELLANYVNYGGLGLNWLGFGSNNLIENQSGSQIHAFTRRGEQSLEVNKHIKSIVRLDHVVNAREGHSFNYINGKYCVNELGYAINGPFSPFSCTKAHINHYMNRSFNDYLAKIKRGASNNLPVYNTGVFNQYDGILNAVEDFQLSNIYKRLCALQVPS
jgi:hypothetical protein